MTPEKWLRDRIEERGIKQTFLADKIGISVGKLNYRLTGRTRMDVPVFLALCKELSLDPMDYLAEAGNA